MFRQLISQLVTALLFSAITLGTILFIIKGIVDLSYRGTYALSEYTNYFTVGMVSVLIVLLLFELIELVSINNRRP